MIFCQVISQLLKLVILAIYKGEYKKDELLEAARYDDFPFPYSLTKKKK